MSGGKSLRQKVPRRCARLGEATVFARKRRAETAYARTRGGARTGRGAGKNTEDRRKKRRRVKGFATIPISPYVRGVRARVRAYRVGTAGSARIYPKVIQTDSKKTPKGILELS